MANEKHRTATRRRRNDGNVLFFSPYEYVVVVVEKMRVRRQSRASRNTEERVNCFLLSILLCVHDGIPCRSIVRDIIRLAYVRRRGRGSEFTRDVRTYRGGKKKRTDNGDSEDDWRGDDFSLVRFPFVCFFFFFLCSLLSRQQDCITNDYEYLWHIILGSV